VRSWKQQTGNNFVFKWNFSQPIAGRPDETIGDASPGLPDAVGSDPAFAEQLSRKAFHSPFNR
jgi:hypothetical protein